MRPRILAKMLVLVLLSAEAFAQDGQLTASLRVNYGAAYRDGTWAPIDVIVKNDKRDIVGFVEISTFDANGTVQSPRYRVPADSPKNSIKRFRLHCRLEGADRIRAQLYNGSRPALDAPLTVQVRPIAEQDFLCLVLDNKPENFGFLSTSLFLGTGQNIRFHREALTTAELAFLADHLVCYTPLNLVVLGEIDPSRISERHRTLLMQYVEQGGTAVVALGRNAGAYKGSWVEDWLGVSLGTSRVYNDKELAERVYSGNTEGTREEREAFVAEFLPRDDVRMRKTDPVLEVVRPYGAGYVVGIAIDAESQVLQGHAEYQRFWRLLVERSVRNVPLNYGMASTLAAAHLPRVAGVELFPVSSVILYLVLYFAIAIVGNWLFWNHFKRREMAWICLVVFSFGFTGYAMVFGTQGRAKKTEIERLEVLEAPGNASIGTLRSLTGVLAAGSGYYSGTLGDPEALAAGSPQMDMAPYQANRASRFSGSRPFTFIQTGDGLIDELRIGASEMRFLDVTKTVALEGAIAGTLDLDPETRYLGGTLENNTGLDLTNVALFYNGVGYTPFEESPGVWRVNTGSNPRNPESYQDTGTPAPYGHGVTDFNTFKIQFRNALLRDASAGSGGNIYGGYPYGGYGGYGGQQTAVLPLPPCLIAWVNGNPLSGLRTDQQATDNLAATLLVARIPIRESVVPEVHPLQVDVIEYLVGATGPGRTGRSPEELGLDAWRQSATLAPAESEVKIRIQLPYATWTHASDTMTLDVYHCVDNDTIERAWQDRQNTPGFPTWQGGPSQVAPAWTVKLIQDLPGATPAIAPAAVDELKFGQVALTRSRYVFTAQDLQVMRKGNTVQFRVFPEKPGYTPPQYPNYGQKRPMLLVSFSAEYAPGERPEGVDYASLF